MAGRGIPGMALHMRIGIRRVALSFPPVSVVSLPPLFELGWPALLWVAVEGPFATGHVADDIGLGR